MKNLRNKKRASKETLQALVNYYYNTRIFFTRLRQHVIYAEDAVVHVGFGSGKTVCRSVTNEWVGNHSVTSLEADARLEVVFTNRTDHL